METKEQLIARVQRCVEQINSILDQEHCVIKPKIHIEAGKIQTGVEIIAIELPQPIDVSAEVVPAESIETKEETI